MSNNIVLSKAQKKILKELSDKEAGENSFKISAQTGISYSYVCNMLGVLKELEYVEKVRLGRTSKVFKITDAGFHAFMKSGF